MVDLFGILNASKERNGLRKDHTDFRQKKYQARTWKWEITIWELSEQQGVEMQEAYVQRSVWREQRQELKDSPGLKGWEGGRVRRLMEELQS